MISTDWVNEGPSDKWIHAFGIKQGKLSCDLAMNRYSKLFEREKYSFEESKDYGMINHGSVLYDGVIDCFRE